MTFFRVKIWIEHFVSEYLSVIDLKTTDYLHVVNADQFNSEIKALAKGSYIESSTYTAKKEKFGLLDVYRQHQNDVATAAFNENSLGTG